MGACQVIDFRRHTGYFGDGSAQEWADKWRAWVRCEVERVERGIKACDLDDVMQAVGGLVYKTRRPSHWGADAAKLQSHWDTARDALLEVGADERLAFVIYWAEHKDWIIRGIYDRIVYYGAELLIKELYDKGLRMRDIDERVAAWRPFDSELSGDAARATNNPVGVRSVDQAAQIRIGMTRGGQLWKPDPAALAEMNAPF